MFDLNSMLMVGKSKYIPSIFVIGTASILPKIELNFPLSVIGRNTEESMQSGIMYGFVELINGLLDKIIDELGGVYFCLHFSHSLD